MDLSILLVSHGHERMIPPCVDSLERGLEGLQSECILVDNLNGACWGEWLGARHEQVSVIRNRVPLGLASNVNRAARCARGRFILQLNPDTVYRRGRLVEALTYMDRHPDIGVIGARLEEEDGRLQRSYRRFPTLPVLVARGLGADRWPWRPMFYRRRLMEAQEFTAPTRVDWVFGATMLMRREEFLALGGMDERFRLYYEDVDLCYRYARAGRGTCYYPGIAFRHEYQRASALAPLGYHWRCHVNSAGRYFRKHRYFFQPSVCLAEARA